MNIDDLGDRILLAVHYRGLCGLRIRSFGDFAIENRFEESGKRLQDEMNRLIENDKVAFQQLSRTGETLFLLTDEGKQYCDNLLVKVRASSSYFVS